MVNEDKSTASLYKYYITGSPMNGATRAYMLGDKDAYIALFVSLDGIGIKGNNFSNPSVEQERETVEVMRELVAEYDRMSGAS